MDFDPQALSALDDPYALFRELRDHHPVFYSAERDLWVLPRYDDVRAVLLDAETFSSGMGTVPTGFVSAKPMMTSQDPPYHTHLRNTGHLAFTPRRMPDLEGFIRKTTRQLLAAIDPERETNLFEAVTDPLPVAVVTELLGIGFEDRHEFSRHAGAIIHAAEGGDTSAEEAIQWIYAYLERVLPERERRAADDLVSRLLHPRPGETRLTHDEGEHLEFDRGLRKHW